MAKAIQLAQQGRFTTSPNPRVGCVIVDENNHLLGQGYHIQAGTPHAEVHALRQASNARPQGAKGATAYVTLEPCSHFWSHTALRCCLGRSKGSACCYCYDRPESKRMR